MNLEKLKLSVNCLTLNEIKELIKHCLYMKKLVKEDIRFERKKS